MEDENKDTGVDSTVPETKEDIKTRLDNECKKWEEEQKTNNQKLISLQRWMKTKNLIIDFKQNFPNKVDDKAVL